MSFRTVLTTPPLVIQPSPDFPETVRVSLEGFGTLPRPGAPAVPARIERVAIPEGSAPELRILRVRDRALSHLSIEPVPTPEGIDEDRPGRNAADLAHPRRPASWKDPRYFDRDALYPPEIVALGGTGRLKDQYYVEVIFSPVQVNPVSGQARIVEKVEIEVLFPGASSAAFGSARGGPEDRMERVYQSSILNYEQAKAFRKTRAAADAPEEGASPEVVGGSTVYKLALRQDGVYRVACTTAPTCTVPALLGQDPNTFRLRNKGVEVPMRVVGGGDGSYDPGDVLEFYGQSQKEPFTVLNCGAPTCPTPIYQYNDVTDVNVYLLDATASTARLRMASLDGTPGGLAVEPHFLETAHWEVNDRFLPLDAADPFYSIPTLTADGATPASRDISVPLPGLASASFSAPVRVRIRGVSSLTTINPDHRTEVTVNGNPSTTSTLDWDGETIVDQTTTASQASLTHPTAIRLEVPVVGGLSLDQVIADFVEIDYRRAFQAESDRLVFTFPNQAAKFTVGGFSAAPILAYDLSRILAGTSDTIEPRLVVNAGTGAGSLTFQVGAEGPPTGNTRRFTVVGPNGYLAPEAATSMPECTLLDPANEADYLIVAHPSLIDSSAGSPYSQFVDFLENTRGLKTRLVSIGEIYDCFNQSIAHPEAIRSFLAHAHDQWVGPGGTSSPPSYLLLLGDAVWDFKNNLNRSDWVDLVPSPIMFYNQAILRYHAADNWLASFLGGDQSADILHGRIPARTVSQANAVFTKFLTYSQSPPGAWRSDGYFLADVGNNFQETDKFELVGDSAAAHFQPPWTSTRQYYAQPPYNAPVGGGADVTAFRTDFLDHWNTAHPAIVSYTGHGAFDLLGNDLFFRSTDIPLLTNAPYFPFFYNSDCLTGGFHAVGTDAIGEVMLQSSTGGAIGTFAPAGLSFTFIGNVVSGSLYGDLFSPQKLREVGTLAARARELLYQQLSIADMQGYALLGDPSLDLILPAPRPPTNFTVAAGNGQVDLAWTASVDPSAVGVNVYRTQSLVQPYAKLNAAPVAGTTYVDASVTNGTTYFYRAVAVDAGGFEGAVTNTNEDCGSSGPPDGPQCRRATPKNLVPPVAPQSVTVRDTGTGSTLDLSWTANPETDIARYLVRFGTSPGSHPTTVNAGVTTTTTLGGLTAGATYYIVVSAVNTSGVEGASSTEVSGVPHVFVGIAPPRTIQDLVVTRSGNDLILSWGAVTTNIYGNPATIDHYNVYRGNTPSFIPSNSTNRLAIVPASPSPSFTHAGGATLADDGFYLVSAIDLEGFASGLGGDLPAGVVTLTVEPSPTPGMLRISWPAVTTTVTGQPATIDHYTLYGSSSPLPRRLIGPGNLLLDSLTGPFTEVPVPADGLYYYNLIVVDRIGNLSPY